MGMKKRASSTTRTGTAIIAGVFGLFTVTARLSAQAPAPPPPPDPAAKALVERLDLERYKATIKGLTQFGDRR